MYLFDKLFIFHNKRYSEKVWKKYYRKWNILAFTTGISATSVQAALRLLSQCLLYRGRVVSLLVLRTAGSHRSLTSHKRFSVGRVTAVPGVSHIPFAKFMNQFKIPHDNPNTRYIFHNHSI